MKVVNLLWAAGIFAGIFPGDFDRTITLAGFYIRAKQNGSNNKNSSPRSNCSQRHNINSILSHSDPKTKAPPKIR